MKISKVNHTRAAVGNKNDHEIGGILYTDPNQKGGSEDLRARIKELNRKSRNLYNIFTPVQAGQEPKAPDREKYADNPELFVKKLAAYEIKKKNFDRRRKCESAVATANAVIKGLCFVEGKVANGMRKNDEIIAGISRTEGFVDRKGRTVLFDTDELVVLALRKSLSATKKEAVVFINAIKNRAVQKSDEQQICDFLNNVRRDCTKLSNPEVVDKIVRGIENQNLIFQTGDNGITVSIPDSKGKRTSYKEREKIGFSKFMEEFSTLDDSARTEVLRKICRIIEVYFASPNNYVNGTQVAVPESVDKDSFEPLTKHDEWKKWEGTFVEIPAVLKQSDSSVKAIDSIEKSVALSTLKGSIRTQNMSAFRYTKAVIEQDKEGLFFDTAETNEYWVHHIEGAVERILKERLADTLFKLDKSYLAVKIWKDAINLISIKYIAIGKAVYQFGMGDLCVSDQDITMGTLPDGLKDGLSSFDYEMIKANETLQREVAVQVSFAVNNLTRATVKPDEKTSDFTSAKLEMIESSRIHENEEDTLKDVLQFFGGKSKWDTKFIEEKYGEKYGSAFISDLLKNMYALRNETFHFDTKKGTNTEQSKDVVGTMFAREAANNGSVERDKFYSNNLPMFYSDSDLEKCLDFIYQKETPRVAQIPAFNTVIVRKNFPKYLTEKLSIKTPSFDADKTVIWQSGVYFLLKQVYYNCFISDDKAKELFIKAVKEEQDRTSLSKEEARYASQEDKNKANANEDFGRRIAELETYAFSEICQNIMTEYNYQNNQKRVVESSNDPLFEKTIFQHYKMLLLLGIANAFAKYVKNCGALKFIANPALKELPEKEAFLPGWKTNRFAALVNNVEKDAELQNWYVTCRFLNGRTLNHLAGTLRSYLQYVDSVKSRSKSASNNAGNLHITESKNVAKIQKALPVVEFCIRLSDVYSNDITDYFVDNDEAAAYLSNFISFDLADTNVSPYEQLRSFCNDGKDKHFDIYMDEKELKVNRNVIMSKLYGPQQIMAEVAEKVTEQELEKYYASSEKIAKYRKEGECETREEQLNLLEFQQLKNKVELASFVEYGELINELLGQLINWSFIRERDLLYFQLGFHYSVLQNKERRNGLPAEYLSITREDGTVINNAILYQIAAMYIGGVALYSVKDKNNVAEGSLIKIKDASTGGEIKQFINYSKRVVNGLGLYTAGLEVFENLNEHDNIVSVRNYLDHFHYYSDRKFSLLDLYSEAFDRFFTYDMKYQKNVLVLLYDILLRHNAIVDFKVGTGTKEYGDKKTPEKKRAQVEVPQLESNVYTYKLKKDAQGKQPVVKADAKNAEFLNTVMRILYYPFEVPEGCKVRTNNSNRLNEDKRDNKSTDKNSYKNSGHSDKKKDEKYRGVSYKDADTGESAFAAALRNAKKK